MKYIKRAALYVGTMLLSIGGVLVLFAIRAAVCAVGAWLVLDEFDYSLPGFFSYMIVGAGLALIVGADLSKE